MSENATRHSQRAAAGLAKAIRQDYTRPDTRIVGPDGTLRILGRRAETSDPFIAYHKFNPARRDARTGKRPRSGAAAAAGSRHGGGATLGFGRTAGAGSGPLGGLLRGPMDVLGRIPLMNLLVTAALAHRLWSFVTWKFFGSRAAAAAAVSSSRDRQLAKRAAGGGAYGGEYDEDDDLDDLDEHAEELLQQMQPASMLPTMLRAALPRPHRSSRAKRAAQQYHSRPRGYRTAHQMLHGGPASVPSNGSGGKGQASGSGAGGRRQAQRRPLGKLEKMDLIVRQQVRAAMLALQQQQVQLLLLQQQQEQGALEAGPALLALPAAAGVAASVSSSGGAPSSGRVQPSAVLLHRQQQQQQQLLRAGRQGAPLSNAVVPAGAAAATGAHAAPHKLQPGPPPPPAYRPLPPELRARLKGARHPGAAALAPAARMAAAGPPPPLGLEQPLCACSASLGDSAAASASGVGAGETTSKALGTDMSRVEGATESAAGAERDRELEEEEPTVVVPRVARGARKR